MNYNPMKMETGKFCRILLGIFFALLIFAKLYNMQNGYSQ